jgi:hypothetical protein
MLWNGNECGRAKVIRISRQPSPVQSMEYLEYLNYFGSMMINDAKYSIHVKLNTGLPWQKQHVSRRRLFSRTEKT